MERPVVVVEGAKSWLSFPGSGKLAPDTDTTVTSGAGSDAGEPAAQPRDDAAPGRRKPVTATEPNSDVPDYAAPEPPGTLRPNNNDPQRGGLVETISEDRVERSGGLIHKVDGMPVKDYVAKVSRERSEFHAQQRKETLSKTKLKKDGTCSAVAIDLRHGHVTDAINGLSDDVVPVANLHPLLRENLHDMLSWKHSVITADRTVPVVPDGRAHFDQPLRHAEVKAVNELLWQRQSMSPNTPLHPDVLGNCALTQGG